MTSALTMFGRADGHYAACRRATSSRPSRFRRKSMLIGKKEYLVVCVSPMRFPRKSLSRRHERSLISARRADNGGFDVSDKRVRWSV